MKIKQLFSPINFSKVSLKVVDIDDKEHDIEAWRYLTIKNHKEETPLVDVSYYEFYASFIANDVVTIKCLNLYYDDEYKVFINGNIANGWANEIGWCKNFRGFIQYRHLVE